MNAESISYQGFSSSVDGREYRFLVKTKADAVARSCTLWIAAVFFRPGGLVFQQGPDITTRKLHDLLVAEAGGSPMDERTALTESDVTDYKSAAARSKGLELKPKKRFPARVTDISGVGAP